MTTFMFWNLFEAGFEMQNGDDRRWRQQAEIINRHRPDVLAITEGWNWQLDDQRLFHRAVEDFGFSDGAFYEAKTNCNQAVMWNDPITAISSAGQPLTTAWWHGFLQVNLMLSPGAEPFGLMVSHLNPFDPTLRRIEGSFLRNRMSQIPRGVLVMDANCVAPGDQEPRTSPNRNFPGQPIGDRVPLESLAETGLVDVGAAFDDRTPTFGHYRGSQNPDPIMLRLDQAWATPSVTLTDYRSIGADEPDVDVASDHRPIVFGIE